MHVALGARLQRGEVAERTSGWVPTPLSRGGAIALLEWTGVPCARMGCRGANAGAGCHAQLSTPFGVALHP
jgi:hypothetical protein